MVVVGLAVTSVGLMAISWAPSMEALYWVGPLLAFGNGISFPSFTSLYSQTCEARDAGEMLGQGNAMGITGRIVGALCAGYAMDAFGLAMPFVMSSLVMAAGAILFGSAYRLLVPKTPSAAA